MDPLPVRSVFLWSNTGPMLYLWKHLSSCCSKKLSLDVGHWINLHYGLLFNLKKSEKLWQKLISLDSSFFYTGMLHLSVFVPTDFSLPLLLRNCSTSPWTLPCVLLQNNQLNLISAFFNTWKEPFAEFFRKHRLRFFSAAQSELGEAVRKQGLKHSGTEMGLVVWK